MMNSRVYRKVSFFLKRKGFRKCHYTKGRNYTRWERISAHPAREVVEIVNSWKRVPFTKKVSIYNNFWYFTLNKEGGIRENWNKKASLDFLQKTIL